VSLRKLRAYQEEAFWAPERLRRFFLLWLRQGGKTTTLGEQSLREMMIHKGRLITYASANLNMGSEMVEKEAKTWHDLLADLQALAASKKQKLEAGVRDSESDRAEWRPLPSNVAWENLADVMERNRLELRLWHSSTVCSRTKIIAASVRTAPSWSGSVKLDEAPFVQDLRNLLAELEPIFSTDPTFKFLMAGTLPPDYAHYSYELGMPADGRNEWPINPKGNWFKNRVGLWVHRVSVDDAAAAGRKVFDPDSGVEQTLEENREMSMDREGWDRSNRHKRPEVGTSAIAPITLDECIARGKARGVAGPDEPPPGWLDLVGKNKLALGLDLATTTNKKSNPSSLALMEQIGSEYVVRFVFWWKTSNPQVTRDKVRNVLMALRLSGKKARMLNVDASNERFFATDLRTAVQDLVPVNLVTGGEAAEYRGEAMIMKAYLGNLLANTAEDGKLALPSHRYLTDDIGRVFRKAGSFEADVGTNGEHGDCFDALKLALFGLAGRGEAFAEAIGFGPPPPGPPTGRNEGRLSSWQPTYKLNS